MGQHPPVAAEVMCGKGNCIEIFGRIRYVLTISTRPLL
jgi:hypothetical protein